MTKRRLGQIDLDTGEVLGNEGFVAYVVPKRKNGFREGWVAMAQGPLDLLAAADLDGSDLRVLLHLLSRLDFENLLVINQVEIARGLSMRREHVNRSIKSLMNLGVLLQGPRIGIHRSYRLNPQFGWKGSAKSHVIALSDFRRERALQENQSQNPPTAGE